MPPAQPYNGPADYSQSPQQAGQNAAAWGNYNQGAPYGPQGPPPSYGPPPGPGGYNAPPNNNYNQVNLFGSIPSQYSARPVWFLKGQGHQCIFSLVKGTLRETCKFLLEHFKGTKAMTRWHWGNQLQCLRKVSGLLYNVSCRSWPHCLPSTFVVFFIELL